ncbi:MAG: nucleoside monophosphate kinase [Candidatus Thiodiazotropha sp.]
MNIVILGGPGSGKKTQTGLLADNYRLTVLAAGELLKQALEEESERGSQLRQQQQAGQQVSDEIMLTLLQEHLRQSDPGNGFILDGFPRNLLQALTLDELLGEVDLSLDFVLLIEIETDALMERLVGRRTCRSCKAVYNVYTHPTAVEDVCDLCGGRLHQRADDTEETVSSRLHVFDHLTAPLLSHYGKQGKVVRVDGEGEVDLVFARTRQAIERFLAERAEAAAVAEQQPAPGMKSEARQSGQKRPAEKASTQVAKPNSAGGAKKSATKAKSQPAAVKQKAGNKGAAGQKKAVVKKAAKKNSLAKKTVAKSVVSKQSMTRKSAVGKPEAEAAAKKRVGKKVSKKQMAKKRVASAKSALATKKKVSAKKATTKKPVPKKTAAAKPKPKKKLSPSRRR